MSELLIGSILRSKTDFIVSRDEEVLAFIKKEDIGYVMSVEKKGYTVNYIVDTLEEAKNVAKAIFERGEE